MELLAPVGNIRALYAAINSGADAVYLGVDGFNARAKAVGFTRENIDEYIDLCHLHGVKVYIAFNTAIKERELKLLDEYVAACTRADAFIVADLGALSVFYKYDVPLHASTQMGVNNLEGALFLQKKGFTRVVVARETAREDIIAIKKNTSLELEYFVHGALCVSYSGSCLLSSMMSGDSGNRGRCNQPCRLRYRSDLNGKEGYLLSPSEQCLITKLDDLKEIGVDSLKIEGRLKQPHYVATVVSQYREVLNGAKADEKRVSELKKAFNRGDFTCGYMYEDTKKIMSPKVQSNIGIPVGKVISSGKNNVTVKSDRVLHDGDGLKFLYKGSEVAGFGVKTLKSAENIYTLSSRAEIPVGSEVRLTLDSQSAEEKIELIKLPVSISFKTNNDFSVEITAKRKDCIVTVKDRAEEATGSPLSETDLNNALCKLGDTPFKCRKAEVDFSGKNIFMPRSKVNALRREVAEKLKTELLRKYDENCERCDYSNMAGACISAKKLSCSRVILNIDKLNMIPRLKSDNIIMSYEIRDFSQFISQIDIFLGLIKNNFSVYLHLPPVVRGSEMKLVREILLKCKQYVDGLICENYYTLQLASEYGLSAIAGIRLNVYNSKFTDISGADSFVCSPELTMSEIKDLQRNEKQQDIFVYAYGLLPVMTLCHCPVQVSTGCDCRNCAYKGDFCYHDKKADYLIKRTKIKNCYFELFNPSLVDISAKAGNFGYNLYINMVNCDKDPCDVIANIRRGGTAMPGSTCAHLFRGVK